MADDTDPVHLQRLVATVDGTPGSVFVLDGHGQVVWTNVAARQTFGDRAEAVLGRCLEELSDGSWPREYAAVHERARRGERVADVPVRAADRHGTPTEMLLTAFPLVAPGGGGLGIGVVLRHLAFGQAFLQAVRHRAWDVAMVADEGGTLRYVSPSVEAVLGYDPGRLVGSARDELVHPDDLETLHAAVAEALVAGGGDPRRVTVRVRHASGSWVWVEDSLTSRLDDPVIRGLVSNIRDVTAEVEARQELEQSQARYRAIVETAHEGIVAASDGGAIIFANERFAELVGQPLERVYDHGVPVALPLATRAVGPSHPPHERYEVEYPHPDGALRVLSVATSPLAVPGQRSPGVLATVFDVTAERRAGAELRRQALHDPLTGLANRALLEDRLRHAAARQARAPGTHLAVLFLDIDGLKTLNDRAGHAAGDALLVEVGHRLTTVVRSTETVARISGDEFAVVCEDGDPGAGLAVARRIEAMFDEPFLVFGRPVDASASIGVATSPPHRPQELLILADTAMYQAKERSRGHTLTFDRDMAEASRRRTALHAGLRTLSPASATLHYQPIVDLHRGRVHGLEALLRWSHPTLGPLPAPEVVAAAAECRSALELDRCVLHAACAQMGALLSGSVVPADCYVSVNVSAATAASEDFESIVQRTLEETGLPPTHLVLELTETAVMADVEGTARRLRHLTGSGVRVAVDDFGTGYSSLAYLHRLPMAILKIDRSFVSGLPRDSDSAAIVRTVLSLADALGLQTVAEGIETVAQAEVLTELGCHSGQGYLWSPAVPPAGLAAVEAIALPPL